MTGIGIRPQGNNAKRNTRIKPSTPDMKMINAKIYKHLKSVKAAYSGISYNKPNSSMITSSQAM